MRYEVRRVGPEDARTYIDNNYFNNRKISDLHVNELAEMMNRGVYQSMNGQTIVIDINGTLYDGQHRMLAIIKTGKTFTFLFVIYDSEEDAKKAYLSIDNGMGRRVSTYINGNQKNDAAALAKRMYAIEHGSAPLLSTLTGRLYKETNVDRIATIGYYDDNKTNVDGIVREARKIRTAIGCGSTSVYGFFIALVKYVSRDSMLDEFVQDISAQMQESATANAYVKLIMKTYMQGNKPTAKWQLGTILDAYEQHLAGNSSVMLNKREHRLKQYDVLLKDAREKSAQPPMIGDL